MSIVALGQDLRTITARSIVTHEYGHHLANSRSNDPWPAVDWGTKRWASYENICKRSKSGELFPGDESEHYEFNPGEDFAENYRVLNERRLGVEELPWQVVDASLYPDQTALDLLAQDITNPWTHATSTTLRGTFTSRATGRGFRVQTPLDGSFSATLQAPAGSRFTLRAVDLATGGQLASSAGTTRTQAVSFQLCGQRTLQLQVKRVKGSGRLHADRLAAVAPSRRRYHPPAGRLGRVVRQRPAKPRTAVRIRQAPSHGSHPTGFPGEVETVHLSLAVESAKIDLGRLNIRVSNQPLHSMSRSGGSATAKRRLM